MALILGNFDRQSLGYEQYKITITKFLLKSGFTGKITFSHVNDIEVPLSSDVQFIIYGGGDIINELYNKKLNSILTNFNGPIIALSVSITDPSVINSNYLKKFSEIILNHTDKMDEISHVVGPSIVSNIPDLSFLLDPQIPTVYPRKTVGIFSVNGYHLEADIKHSLDKLSSEFNVVLFSMNNSRNIHLSDYFSNILIGPFNSYFTNDVYNLMSHTGGLHLAICVNYYAHVFCILQNIPFVSITSDDNVRVLMENMGFTKNVVKYGTDLQKAIDYSLNHYDELKQQIQKVHIDYSRIAEHIKPLQLKQFNPPEDEDLCIKVENHVSPVSDHIPKEHSSKEHSSKEHSSKEHSPKEHSPKGGIISTLKRELSTVELKVNEEVQEVKKEVNEEVQEVKKEFNEEVQEVKKEFNEVTKEVSEEVQEVKENVEHDEHRLKNFFSSLFQKKEKYQGLRFLQPPSTFSGVHRGGWESACKALKALENPKGVLCDLYVDASFHWKSEELVKQGILPYNQLWVGFIHHTNLINYTPYNTHSLFKSPLFLQSLKTCRCLIVLSENLRDFVQKQVTSLGFDHVIVKALKHPTETTSKNFDFREWLHQPTITQVGAFLRDTYAIYALRNTWARKQVLQGSNMESYIHPDKWYFVNTLNCKCKHSNLHEDEDEEDEEDEPQISRVSNGNGADTVMTGFMTLWAHKYGAPTFLKVRAGNRCCEEGDAWPAEYIQKVSAVRGLFLRNYQSVKVIKHLTTDEYDDLLSKTVVFINLLDCSGCNTIVECIQRSTPLMVNKVPAAIEYLGNKYPGFYNDFIHDANPQPESYRISRILDNNKYMIKMDKSQFSLDQFMRNVENLLGKYVD
jgi:hypothetical protein